MSTSRNLRLEEISKSSKKKIKIMYIVEEGISIREEENRTRKWWRASGGRTLKKPNGRLRWKIS